MAITCISCGGLARRHGDSKSRQCYACAQETRRIGAKAVYTVRGAVHRGLLEPARTLKCVDCGKPARDYDHRDYSKPLDVVPVCHSCNIKRGPAALGNAAARMAAKHGA